MNFEINSSGKWSYLGQFEPRIKNSRIQNLKILNFEFCLSFKSVPGYPPFPTTQNTKKLFL